MGDPEETKIRRRKLLRNLITVFLVGSILGVGYAARTILMPCFVAVILAYLFKPVVYVMRARGVPSWAAVTSIVSVLVVFLVFGFKFAQNVLPQGTDRLEARIRAEHRLNEALKKTFRVQALEDGSWGSDFWLYNQFKGEWDHLISRVNGELRISEKDEALLLEKYERHPDTKSERYRNFIVENQSRKLWVPAAKSADSPVDEQAAAAHLTHLFGQVAMWILFPIIFFFLLSDDGRIFRFGMRFVPNHFFELTLTILERVDNALGHYLRGTALECSLVGACIGVGLFIFGVDLQSAFVIGFIAGLANAIPFLGPVVGLVVGLSYALVAESISPLLPFLGADDIIVGVLVSVGFAKLLDDAIFQPVLIGKAVHLHPIVVVVAAAAGGVGFGFIGVLLAIPVIVVTKTCLETLFRGLQEYRLI